MVVDRSPVSPFSARLLLPLACLIHQLIAGGMVCALALTHCVWGEACVTIIVTDC